MHAITNLPHPEERPSAASRRTHHVDADAPTSVNPLLQCGRGAAISHKYFDRSIHMIDVTAMYIPQEIIRRKRDGAELTAELEKSARVGAPA